MKRNQGYKPETKMREAVPKLGKGKEAQILCPFCQDPHPLSVGVVSPCGTSLRVMAEQMVIPTRTVHKHKLRCVKCGKSDGEMVKWHQGYVHLHECTPNTRLMVQPPEFSRAARFVYGMPAWMKKMIEPYTGEAKPVKEVDPQGAELDKVLGYFFYRKTGGKNATA